MPRGESKSFTHNKEGRKIGGGANDDEYKNGDSNSNNDISRWKSNNRVTNSNDTKRGYTAPINFCKFFIDGSCKYGRSCRYKHALRRVAILDPCTEGIISCGIAKTKEGLVEFYTGTMDRSLKRWVVCTADDRGNMNVCLQNTTPFVDNVTCCAFFSDCLFCGLKNGDIKCFHRITGSSRNLIGHRDAVQCLIFVNNTLISGCNSGEVCIWNFDVSVDSFLVINKIYVDGFIRCMREVKIIDNWYLWVGGSLLTIIDLQTSQQVKKLALLKYPIMALVPYENHMIAGYSNGTVKVFTLDGTETYTYCGDNISSMDGMLVNDEPILFYGTNKGYVRFLRLPEFEEIGYLRVHEQSDVKVSVNLGSDYFLTCAADGSLNIWLWTKPTY